MFAKIYDGKVDQVKYGISFHKNCEQEKNGNFYVKNQENKINLFISNVIIVNKSR